jgi:hypothetical protein
MEYHGFAIGSIEVRNYAVEALFDSMGITTYERRPDGLYCVHGSLDMSNRGLVAMPDLACVQISGSFSCAFNKLVSLKGCPTKIGKDFYCDNNVLLTLHHAPSKVRGIFDCRNNLLHSLSGAPKEFEQLLSDHGEFWCYDDLPASAKF